MERHLEKKEAVELIGGKPVVLEEDVTMTEGYFERRQYAFVGENAVFKVKTPMTLRQVLQLEGTIKEEVRLYVVEGDVRTKKKESKVKEATTRPSRAKKKPEAKQEESS